MQHRPPVAVRRLERAHLAALEKASTAQASARAAIDAAAAELAKLAATIDASVAAKDTSDDSADVKEARRLAQRKKHGELLKRRAALSTERDDALLALRTADATLLAAQREARRCCLSQLMELPSAAELPPSDGREIAAHSLSFAECATRRPCSPRARRRRHSLCQALEGLVY